MAKRVSIRPSISVSGKTYARLRKALISGSVAGFVDDLIAHAIDDPAIAARVVALCKQGAA